MSSQPKKPNGSAERPVQATLQDHHAALEDLGNTDRFLLSEMRVEFTKVHERFNRLETILAGVLRHVYVPEMPKYPKVID